MNKILNMKRFVTVFVALLFIASFSYAGAWDLHTGIFNQTRSVGNGICSSPLDVHFNGSGNRMYILCNAASPNISQWNLSTAWDINSSIYDNTFPITRGNNQIGFDFSPDGSMVFTVDKQQDSIHKWNLTSNWNIMTATNESSVNLSSYDLNLEMVAFKNDGTIMYTSSSVGATETNHKNITQWILSPAWDIRTATKDKVFIYGQPLNSTLTGRGLFFNDSGTRMYMVFPASPNRSVSQWNLSIAWDVTSATHDSFFRVNNSIPPENNPNGVFFNASGNRMYVTGSTGDIVSEWHFAEVNQSSEGDGGEGGQISFGFSSLTRIMIALLQFIIILAGLILIYFRITRQNNNKIETLIQCIVTMLITLFTVIVVGAFLA